MSPLMARAESHAQRLGPSTEVAAAAAIRCGGGDVMAINASRSRWRGVPTGASRIGWTWTRTRIIAAHLDARKSLGKGAVQGAELRSGGAVCGAVRFAGFCTDSRRLASSCNERPSRGAVVRIAEGSPGAGVGAAEGGFLPRFAGARGELAGGSGKYTPEGSNL